MLARAGIVTEDLARRFAGVVKVRNRVAHGDSTVDPARFWHDLPAGIAVLREFAAALAAFVRQLPPA